MSAKKVGLILPSVNVYMEPEFYRMGLPGINFYATRVMLKETTPESLIAMEKDLEHAAELIASVKPDVVAYACTSGSFINGKKWDLAIMEKITAIAQCPSVTTSFAMINAVKSLGIKNLTLITPYIDRINIKEKEYFEDNGIKVASMKGLQITDAEILHAKTPGEIKEVTINTYVPEADGIFISCTDFRALEAAEELETILHKPVVTSSQATLWWILKSIGYKGKIDGYGKLLRDF